MSRARSLKSHTRPANKTRAMARMRESVSLKHRPNLGTRVSKVEFVKGQEVTILKQWADGFLIKNDEGQLFNVPTEFVEP